MAAPRIVFYFMLLGFLLTLVKCQSQISTTEETVSVVVDDEEDDTSDEDSDEENIYSLLNNVTGIDDFMGLLRINGNPVQSSDVFSEYDSESGKLVIAGGGRMAVPDGCSARRTTVRLQIENTDPRIVYFPKCTMIERCGGCCSSPNVECVPSYTERVSLGLFKAVIPRDGSSHLDFIGTRSVIVDRHVSCRVQCMLTREKCGPLKKFNRNQCSCTCRSYLRCSPPHVWDPETCACRCAEVISCCAEGEICNLVFNEDSCGCDVGRRQHISLNSNLTSEQIEAYNAAMLNGTLDVINGAGGANVLPENNPSQDSHVPSSPTPTSTTTTTTTTTTTSTSPTTTTTADPCSTISCPPNFTHRRIGTGSCTCTLVPRGRFRFRPSRRRPIRRG